MISKESLLYILGPRSCFISDRVHLHWNHAQSTQRVMEQDYDLDIIEGWSGDYGKIAYINIDGNSCAPRHDEG
eukprot:SAG11_NODE_9562_length_900_cov_1.815231_1_plen_72_part_10